MLSRIVLNKVKFVPIQGVMGILLLIPYLFYWIMLFCIVMTVFGLDVLFAIFKLIFNLLFNAKLDKDLEVYLKPYLNLID